MLRQINIQDIVAIAKEAGYSIMQVYEKDFKVEYKEDNSPLTLADRKSNEIIESGLKRLSVDFPILSEESKEIPYNDRKHWEYFWLVDPLDGTKEFVNKNDEFTVNIALIHKDTPILGVVYAPALDVCYWAKQGKGAFKDGQKLPIAASSQYSSYKIVASRSHMSDETQTFIDMIDTDKNKELISIGSSLKICIIAEGGADIYPRLSPTMEWDTGAAHAIVRESNCQLCVFNKETPLLYNTLTMVNPFFIVST